MQGKLVMITGANSGIGRAAAMALASMGADLVLVCRSPEKGKKVKDDIEKTRGSAELIVGDLLLQSEVRKVAFEFGAAHSKLDVLVNNAGTAFMSYGVTSEGVERTMAVNYFAPFLLTSLLLDSLKAASPSRVVNVSSSANYSGRIDLSRLANDDRMGTGGLAAYARSKLALVDFTYELSRRLEESGVAANCLHPGAVRTGIWGRAGVFSPLTRFASLFMLSPEKGAETVVYLASSPEVKDVTGKYFEKMRPKHSSRLSYDDEFRKKLWLETERIVDSVARERTGN